MVAMGRDVNRLRVALRGCQQAADSTIPNWEDCSEVARNFIGTKMRMESRVVAYGTESALISLASRKQSCCLPSYLYCRLEKLRLFDSTSKRARLESWQPSTQTRTFANHQRRTTRHTHRRHHHSHSFQHRSEPYCLSIAGTMSDNGEEVEVTSGQQPVLPKDVQDKVGQILLVCAAPPLMEYDGISC